VLFTKKHNPASVSLILQDGTQLLLKNECKYVGVAFQRSGSYSLHIHKAAAICRDRLNAIRLLKGASWGAGKRPLLTVYRSLVRSVIEYGMESPSLLKPLHKIRNDALRLCTGAMASTRVICLDHACGEMPLNIKHKFLCLRFKARLLSLIHRPTLSLIEDCWQARFSIRRISAPLICSQRLRMIIPFSPPLPVVSRIFLLGRCRNPLSISLSHSSSIRRHLL